MALTTSQNVSFTDCEASIFELEMKLSDVSREERGQIEGCLVQLHLRTDEAEPRTGIVIAHMVKLLETGSLPGKRVANLTLADEVLNEARRKILHSWPKRDHDSCLKSFCSHINELVVKGLLL